MSKNVLVKTIKKKLYHTTDSKWPAFTLKLLLNNVEIAPKQCDTGTRKPRLLSSSDWILRERLNVVRSEGRMWVIFKVRSVIIKIRSVILKLKTCRRAIAISCSFLLSFSAWNTAITKMAPFTPYTVDWTNIFSAEKTQRYR